MHSLRLHRTALLPSALRRCLATAAATPAAPALKSPPSSVKRVGVVGAGQMGQGIGVVTAVHARLPVMLVDVNAESLKRAMDFIGSLLAKDVSKGKMSAEDSKAALARFSTSTNMEALADADFVVEAATENVDLKKKIFSTLSQVTRPGVILASNTSSISITKIAAATSRPDQVIGMHFMNPVPVMKLVEVISGLQTSPATLATTLHMAESMGKVSGGGRYTRLRLVLVSVV
jgi:3-hydroxybutyryl-CoA dehydrogenase